MEITTGRKTRPRGYITDYNPQKKTLDLLDQVQAVLDEYEAYWPLTVRQIFYRLVGKFEYAKDEAAYERLCTHLNNARRARIIPFEAIRDDGVTTVNIDHYDDADHFRRHVRQMAEGYQRNIMASQPVHIEVWCEAAGMIFQLHRAVKRYSIHVFSSSGFDSTTARKALADRICEKGKRAVILHLGDYDPSGDAIFKSLADDVSAFVEADRPFADVTVRFKRVCLTAEQVLAFGLPTAEAKKTDSRWKAWAEQPEGLKGRTCQLEALAPDQIANILRRAVLDEIEIKAVMATREIEATEREELTKLLLMGPSDAGRSV